MGRSGILILTVVCLHAAVLHAASDPVLRGRDLVRLGIRETVTGTLASMEGEWFLESEDGVYELHFGDHRHRAETGVVLEEGIEATVFGFILEDAPGDYSDLAVCSMVINGEVFRFREDDGTPLWRGQGGGGGKD